MTVQQPSPLELVDLLDRLVSGLLPLPRSTSSGSRLDAVGPGAGCVRQLACPRLRPACRRVAEGAAPAERLAGQAKEVAEAVQSLRTYLEGAKTSGSPKAARQKVGSPCLPSGPKLPSSEYIELYRAFHAAGHRELLKCRPDGVMPRPLPTAGTCGSAAGAPRQGQAAGYSEGSVGRVAEDLSPIAASLSVARATHESAAHV